MVSCAFATHEVFTCVPLQCARGEKGVDRSSYGPYLYALDPSVLAVLTMHGRLCYAHASSYKQCMSAICTSTAAILAEIGMFALCSQPVQIGDQLPSSLRLKLLHDQHIYCVQVHTVTEEVHGCLMASQDMCCDCAGALGILLTDDEAGRVKLVRVAMSIGKVSPACPLLIP